MVDAKAFLRAREREAPDAAGPRVPKTTTEPTRSAAAASLASPTPSTSVPFALTSVSVTAEPATEIRACCRDTIPCCHSQPAGGQ